MILIHQSGKVSGKESKEDVQQFLISAIVTGREITKRCKYRKKRDYKNVQIMKRREIP